MGDPITPVFSFVNLPTYVSKGKVNNVKRHNNKKSLLIYSFCKNKGHSEEYVDECNKFQYNDLCSYKNGK